MIDADRSSQRIQELESLLANTPSTIEKIDNLTELAWELRISQPEKAEEIAREAIQLSKTGNFEETPYCKGQAAGMVALAGVEFQKGMIEEGVKHCLQALNLLENEPVTKTNSRTWYILSWKSFFLGDYAAAKDQAFKALEKAKQLSLDIEKAWALDALASADGITKEFSSAIKAHEQAIRIFEDSNDADGYIRAVNNLAMTLQLKQDYVAALEWAKKSLQAANNWGRNYDALNVACTIAQILIELGQLDDADTYLKSAFSDATAVQNTHIYHVFVLMEWASIYQKRNDIDNAKSYLIEALQLAKENKQSVELGECNKILADIYEQEGQYQKSVEHLKAYLAIHDEAVGERASIRMSILTITHQIENAKKEAEIYRLKAEQLSREVEEEKKTKELFEKLSTIDGLTGVSNRRHFDHMLEQEYMRHSRNGQELSLIMLDIDHFKNFNDTYGHLKGDDCLKTIAQTIKSLVARTTDTVARYGGEEFVCILPETQIQAATQIAQSIRQTVFDLAIPSRASTTADRVTVSIGVITARCHPKGSLNALMERVDEQLYLAKANGRNRVSSASSHTHQLPRRN